MAKMIFFSLMLLIVASTSNGLITDQSEIENFAPDCKSMFKVKFDGRGKAPCVCEAIEKCKVECEAGADEFKSDKCPLFCGLLPAGMFASAQKITQAEVCKLCPKDKTGGVAKCKSLVDVGVTRCKKACDAAKPSKVGTDYVVLATSGGISFTFDSVIEAAPKR